MMGFVFVDFDLRSNICGVELEMYVYKCVEVRMI